MDYTGPFREVISIDTEGVLAFALLLSIVTSLAFAFSHPPNYPKQGLWGANSVYKNEARATLREEIER